MVIAHTIGINDAVHPATTCSGQGSMTQEPFLSYAQTMEDVMLWRALRDVGPGFYIDVGAADPDHLSVTRAFYDRGWHGIDVEPLPEQAARLQHKRPRDIVVEAALAESSGVATFYRVEKDGDIGLSTLDEAEAARSGGTVAALQVRVTTLAALCREHVRGTVHFLKIDVEGAEAAVLRGADFAVTRPWIILVESARPHAYADNGDDLKALLDDAGYIQVWFDGLNSFYVAKEQHARLAKHFQVPPNPFDHYKVADLQRDRLLADTLELSQARLELISALRSDISRLEEAQLPSPQPALPQPAAPQPIATPVRNISPARRAALLAYRVVRPVVRPLAWRLRTFLIADMAKQLAETSHHTAESRERLAQLDDRLVHQFADLRTRISSIEGRQHETLEHVAVIRARPALDAELAEAAEQLLLTLSLQRDRN